MSTLPTCVVLCHEESFEFGVSQVGRLLILRQEAVDSISRRVFLLAVCMVVVRIDVLLFGKRRRLYDTPQPGLRFPSDFLVCLVVARLMHALGIPFYTNDNQPSVVQCQDEWMHRQGRAQGERVGKGTALLCRCYHRRPVVDGGALQVLAVKSRCRVEAVYTSGSSY
jgi:hypothetical protein